MILIGINYGMLFANDRLFSSCYSTSVHELGLAPNTVHNAHKYKSIGAWKWNTTSSVLATNAA